MLRLLSLLVCLTLTTLAAAAHEWKTTRLLQVPDIWPVVGNAEVYMGAGYNRPFGGGQPIVTRLQE